MNQGIRKIGAFFRRAIGAETGLTGRHLCGICGQPTEYDSRKWSSHHHAYIDENCIPAYIRNLGAPSVRKWLDGTFGTPRR